MMHCLIPLILFALTAVSPALADSSGWGPSVDFSHGRLRVSDNNRFLVHEDGTPFFWQGDTAWLVIRKYTREDTDRQPSVLKYLESRARQGFNVIQCQLANDAKTTDAYGHKAFVDGRFDQPVWSPGFSRFGVQRDEPPEGGTPNARRPGRTDCILRCCRHGSTRS